MNKNIEKTTLELKDELVKNPLIDKYIRLKKLIEESSELNKLKSQLEYLKKCDMSEEDKIKYRELMKEYSSNPLIVEFNNINEAVVDLLNEIKEEIEN